ncbi:hypothetical protein GJV76_15260 [Myroides sp. BIT-d1]|uniref:Uncharacterized protein n=1 Tax=Myroides albus TaxID=2562892 RepID=A0A6I3LNW3_9FLAO|nr:hypothetical protein [Myroides albus]MTG99457.1 hypothetical protein [Myroides albus]
MKAYLSIIFVLFFSISFGQGILEPGVRLRDEGKYEESISYYLNEKKEGYWDWGHKYNYAKVLALAGQVDSCFFYLEENINKRIAVQSLRDKEFIGIKEDKRWTTYEQSVINKHIPCKDVTFSAEIFRILALSDKESTNIKLLFELINKKGWPKQSQVGDAASYIFATLIYEDLFLVQAKKHLKELKELCIKGEIDCEYFADTYDLVQKKANKPQKYGAIFNIDYDNDFKRIYYKFVDEKKINKWRTEIGLKKLEEFSD